MGISFRHGESPGGLEEMADYLEKAETDFWSEKSYRQRLLAISF